MGQKRLIILFVVLTTTSTAVFGGVPGGETPTATAPSFAGAAAGDSAAMKAEATAQAKKWSDKTEELEKRAKADQSYSNEAKQAAQLRDIYAKQATVADEAVNKNGILDKTKAYGEYLDTGNIKSNMNGQDVTVNIPESSRSDYAASAPDGTTAAEMKGVTAKMNGQNYDYSGISGSGQAAAHTWQLQGQGVLASPGPSEIQYQATTTTTTPTNYVETPKTTTQGSFVPSTAGETNPSFAQFTNLSNFIIPKNQNQGH